MIVQQISNVIYLYKKYNYFILFCEPRNAIYLLTNKYQGRLYFLFGGLKTEIHLLNLLLLLSLLLLYVGIDRIR